MQERGLQGEEEGVEKKLEEVRERGSRKRLVQRLTTTGEKKKKKKKGNNRQEGRGGSG